jgi:hypothetical protein
MSAQHAGRWREDDNQRRVQEVLQSVRRQIGRSTTMTWSAPIAFSAAALPGFRVVDSTVIPHME